MADVTVCFMPISTSTTRPSKEFEDLGFMKIATITFQAAHNFGSVLQAYALQTFVEQLYPDCTYQILNYRSKVQKDVYAVTTGGGSAKAILKNVLKMPYKKDLQLKYNKFENFITQELNLTEAEINDEQKIPDEWKKYDVYISGSDQVWNVRALDFSNVNYLSFVTGVRKVSYAASFGPLKIDWDRYDADRYRKLLEEFNYISVREEGSAENVRFLTGRDCEVHVDPTLLLSADAWRKIQSDADYHNGDYILLYCLEPTRQQMDMAKLISKKLNLPIVHLKPANKNDIINSFVKKYDSGPKDFLAYIDHCALVLTSSFHGTAFSLIYSKPFYVFNGMEDKRISSILKATEQTARSIESLEDIENVKMINSVNLKWDKVEAFLSFQRKSSESYLRRAICDKE